MKSKLITAVTAMICMQAHAYDLPYLNFQCNDGSVYSLESEGLDMTLTDGKLLALNSANSLELEASSIDKMWFSAHPIAGIYDMNADLTDQAVTAYDLRGCNMGTFANLGEAKAKLPAGVFMLYSKGRITKISIEK